MKENRIYNDCFESFLKEAADEFTMQPSRRIWTGIYNSVHPGRKYPSYSTLMIVSALVIFAGFNGSRNFNKIGDKDNTTIIQNLIQKSSSGSSIAFSKLELKTISNSFVKENGKVCISKSTFNNDVISNSMMSSTTEDHLRNSNQITLLNSDNNAISDINISLNSYNTHEKSFKQYPVGDGTNEFNEKQWVENFAFANLKSNKSKNQINIELYASPSIGFRSMNRTTDKVIAIPSLMAQTNQNEQNALHHLPGYNVEAGGSISVGINNLIRLKAGMQFNYSGYQVVANNLDHNVGSYLQMKEYSNGLGSVVFRNSHIENVSLNQQGEKLQNSSYQISIPLGTEFILAENKSFEWSAGANVQPSYVFGGSPYLISADMNNYINDASLIRKWNINAGLETYISFKLKNGTFLNAGPQFRYQLLSTYDSRCIYNEKLYNLGLKFGVSKKL